MVLSHSLSRSKLTRSQSISLQVSDRLDGQIYHFSLFTWNTIEDIKSRLHLERHIEPSVIRLYLQQQELENKQPIQFYITNDASLLKLGMDYSKESIFPLYDISCPDEQRLIQEVQSGFQASYIPELSQDGTSGIYFLKNASGAIKAVFKPYDEEPYCPNNPRGYIGKMNSTGFRQGIRSGESAIREMIAYQQDKLDYFNIPLTLYVAINHPVFNQKKIGCLQAFVEHDDIIANFGSRAFTEKEAHKVAILDLHIVNCDRNEQNILVKKILLDPQTTSEHQLPFTLHFFPIDHGLSFPDCFDTFSYDVIWMRWPQSKQPFSESEKAIIQSFEPFKDAEMISNRVSIRKHCLMNFIIANILLKKAAQENLTPYEIGSIMFKMHDEPVSTLQQIIQRINSIIPVIASFDNDTLPCIQKDYQAQITKRSRKLSQQDLQFEEDMIDQKNIQMMINNISDSEDDLELFKRRYRKRSISDPNLRDSQSQIEVSDEKKYRKLFFYYLDHFLDIIIKKKKSSSKLRFRKNSLNS